MIPPEYTLSVVMARKFDEHKHIKYKSLGKLFWNKFAYRVNLRDKLVAPVWISGWAYMRNADEARKWKEHQEERRAFYRQCQGSCPRRPDDWKSMWCGLTYSFFFVHEKDAKAFIRKYKDFVSVVHRPDSEAQLEALKQEHVGPKPVLRETLYYPTENNAGYRYCIEFHHQYNKSEEEELDNMVQFIFNEKKNSRRYMYLYSKNRRLYLVNEKDIVHVKLALFDKIKRQSKVILKSEV